ncbi:hypothetical protein CHS0354_030750 [Potamilus streckersoni]|uniref:Uncharacterized protein n=1 Tax=Potamilus streckersoni TaxID=2493646 RepID=A0AAE0TDA8_9BIVA|nr:hypothetical protein CHS0354_030750 [Potamilus streckersoni]
MLPAYTFLDTVFHCVPPAAAYWDTLFCSHTSWRVGATTPSIKASCVTPSSNSKKGGEAVLSRKRHGLYFVK